MPATIKVPLGAITYVHKWYMDVNDTKSGGTYAVPVWTGCFGTSDFKFSVDPTTKDDGDFDSVGWGSEVVSSRKWNVTTTFLRKTVDGTPTAYDPGQEILRAAGLELGASNRVDVRIYEMVDGGPKVEAYRGYASVSWVPSGGSNDEIEKVVCTLNGSGELESITHPDGAAVVPVLTSLTPATGEEEGGELIRIAGTGFFADGVDDVVSIAFGATDAPTFTTISDNLIVVAAPVHAVGAINVTVTNTVGVSISTATYAYTT